MVLDDRRLLERAARAAGIELWLEWDDNGPTGRYRLGYGGDTWNPLADDGDALRLAVRLRMFVDVVDGSSGVQILERAFCSEAHGSDPLAATRRAIVRAAAEIGESMAKPE